MMDPEVPSPPQKQKRDSFSWFSGSTRNCNPLVLIGCILLFGIFVLLYYCIKWLCCRTSRPHDADNAANQKATHEPVEVVPTAPVPAIACGTVHAQHYSGTHAHSYPQQNMPPPYHAPVPVSSPRFTGDWGDPHRPVSSRHIQLVLSNPSGPSSSRTPGQVVRSPYAPARAPGGLYGRSPGSRATAAPAQAAYCRADGVERVPPVQQGGRSRSPTRVLNPPSQVAYPGPSNAPPSQSMYAHGANQPQYVYHHHQQQQLYRP